MRPRAETRADEIIEVVIDLIETEGYDAIQVRTVAASARISLTTLYKLFGTLDELIAIAVERWLEANAYATLTMPAEDESAYETLVGVLRAVFQPWEQHPNMLVAYHRALSRPGGDRLVLTGLAIVRPIAEAALQGVDPLYLDDLQLIHGHVVRAAIARFADGEIEVTDILPILERTLFRLMNDNHVGGTSARPREIVSPNPRPTTKRSSLDAGPGAGLQDIDR
jgi:TetR/AcrR family transcriptional regulator, cholesterol catabolism regulator